jgi:general secretion pathway protein G
MKLFNKKRIGGFTLIEMMVVITIIGLLSAIVMSSFDTARKKGRVAKRIADLKQIQTSLELYYATNRKYPSSSGSWSSCLTNNIADNVGGPSLVPTYIGALPEDPQYSSGSSANCYFYRSDGSDYAVRDDSTEMTSSAPNFSTYPELNDPARSGSSWKVYSSGASGW